MTAPRSRKVEKEYEVHKKTVAPTQCPFCTLIYEDSLIEQAKHFKVIRNVFPYSVWDGQGVEDHLMITPNTHTANLSKMTTAAKAEFVDLLEKYESRGYNIYARSPGSKIKTIVHQHTHLIKPTRRIYRFVFMMHTPHINIAR